MNLQKVIELIGKYKIFLIVSLILTFLISSYAALNIKNVYRASAMMVVGMQKSVSSSSAQMTYSDYTLSIGLVNSYRVLCKSDKVLNQVIAQTGLPLSSNELSKKISVGSEINTDILYIQAEDQSPARAALIANSTAAVVEGIIPQLMNLDNVKIVDPAGIPSAPVSPNRKAIVILSLLGCLVFCGLVIALIESFDNTVRSEDQLESILKAPVLCSIPHSKDHKRMNEKLPKNFKLMRKGKAINK